MTLTPNTVKAGERQREENQQKKHGAERMASLSTTNSFRTRINAVATVLSSDSPVL